MGRDARRERQSAAFEAARRLPAEADTKVLALQIRSLGVGQTLAIHARKSRFGVGTELARWLARLEPALAPDEPDLPSAVARAWRRLTDRRRVQQIELEAIAFADDLASMVAVHRARSVKHLPIWAWNAEPRRATATRAAVLLEFDELADDSVREAIREVASAPADLDGDSPVGEWASALRAGQPLSRIRQRIQRLPILLRQQGLAGGLAVLHNECRTREYRSALANLIVARLRGHPAGLFGDGPVAPAAVVGRALGRVDDGGDDARALATARVLEDESLHWAQALKYAVTTLVEER